MQLADSSLVNDIPTNIDILIGSDHYFDVVTDEICRGDKGPVPINTIFGWVISGPTQKDIKDDVFCQSDHFKRKFRSSKE